MSAPCVSMEDRLEADRERSASAERRRDAERQRAEREREQRYNQSLNENRVARENRMALSMLLVVLGLISLGGGGILYVKNRHRPAYIAAGAGGLLIVAAGVLFLTRPTSEDVREEAAEEAGPAETAAFTGANVCRLVPDRSRVTVSSDERVELDWSDNGCVNGRTQYSQDGESWSRVLVPNEEQTVSVLEVRPDTREYIVSRYLLGAEAMSQARQLRRRVSVNSCTTNEERRADLAEGLQEIRRILPELPNERLVYECTGGGGGEREEGSTKAPSRTPREEQE